LVVATRSAPAVLADALVIDAHVHSPHLLPRPFRSIYRLVNARTMPVDVSLDELGPARVDAVVCNAVGDPIVTRLYRGDPWAAVLVQLDLLVGEIRRAGCRLVLNRDDLLSARTAGQPAVLLGLEGADAIGRRLDRVEDLYRLGVRTVVPVHLGDNQIGTTALPWQRYLGPLPAGRSRSAGLTRLGRDVIAHMDELGIIIDVSHADEATTLGIAAISRRPIVASHTGARACQDFARYLSDKAATSVAESGGVIGLWPYFHRRRGAANVASLLAQAAHFIGLVGARHLCIGTDMNGVPGLMEGYRTEADLPVIAAALLRMGVDEADVRGIMGENVLRVLEAVVGR
jgi:membrane dipeptidase